MHDVNIAGAGARHIEAGGKGADALGERRAVRAQDQAVGARIHAERNARARSGSAGVRGSLGNDAAQHLGHVDR